MHLLRVSVILLMQTTGENCRSSYNKSGKINTYYFTPVHGKDINYIHIAASTTSTCAF